MALKTGFEVSTLDVKFTSAPLPNIITRNEKQTIYAVPIGANYSINNWFSLEGGFTLDIPKEDYNSDNQLGLGYEFGPKFSLNKNNFELSVFPNFSQRGLIPFDKEKNYERLTEFGGQLSAGYKF